MLQAELPLGEGKPSLEGWRSFLFSCVRIEKGVPGEEIHTSCELCHSWECRQNNKEEHKPMMLIGGLADFTTRDGNIELDL